MDVQDVEIISETKRPKKKSREQILKDKIKIRLAPDGAGVLIQKLLSDNGIELPIDWTKGIYPYWLLATIEDDVIGCIQVVPAKPFGMIEFLTLNPSSSVKVRAIAIKKLILQASAVLIKAGCEYSISTVNDDNEKFMNIISKYAIKITDASIFMKALR